MPKQKGLYQLKGKTQGMCFYQQAGVDLGLMRRINEGMSERVKTSDEFVNTRKNANEFALAHYFAAAAYQIVTPSWRSMYRRFAIALMTNRALDYIKQGTGDWGERIPAVSVGPMLEDMLINFAKNGPYSGQYGLMDRQIVYSADIDRQYTYPDIRFYVTSQMGFEMNAQGIDGLVFTWRLLLMGHNSLLWNSWLQYFGGAYEFNLDLTHPAGGVWVSKPSPDLSQICGDAVARDVVLQGATSGILNVVTICPYRLVNNVRNILQKKCTYVAYGIKPEHTT